MTHPGPHRQSGRPRAPSSPAPPPHLPRGQHPQSPQDMGTASLTHARMLFPHPHAGPQPCTLRDATRTQAHGLARSGISCSNHTHASAPPAADLGDWCSQYADGQSPQQQAAPPSRAVSGSRGKGLSWDVHHSCGSCFLAEQPGPPHSPQCRPLMSTSSASQT